tara:strand:- start:698 stop:1561 length:864 start_codon:yes stop_codon:yes gene_type:complete
MKGIILSGGSGSRLYPLTLATSKQLLSVYDKPMIYYPLCTLMSANIKDILLITTKVDKKNFQKLLGNGSQWGISISYKIQDKPNGIAEAFIIGKDFIGEDHVALILGDNIFNGIDFSIEEIQQFENQNGAKVFVYEVPDPERYGVAEIKNGNVTSIVEKPKKPKSNFAITGLYFYDNNVIKYALSLKPSKRNELEISDINKIYLSKKKLSVKKLGKGVVWLDAGTFISLLQSSQYIQTLQDRQNTLIGSPEEIAYLNNFIQKKDLKKIIIKYSKNAYGRYLSKLINK